MFIIKQNDKMILIDL